MKNFKEISWKQINESAIKLIGKDWMLIGAGNQTEGFNMMTASWGGLGWLWEKPVSFIFVRPQRFTFQFVENQDYYSICFFTEKYREALKICGEISGRDGNKAEKAGLTPIFTPNKNIAFQEADLILECKKLYSDTIKESNFIDTKIISDKYPLKDFHKVYVGEIVKVWRNIR